MIQNVADESGYTIDSQIIGSTDVTTKKLLATANRIIREAGDAYIWPQLTKQYTFTLVSGQATYALPEDINFQLSETMWNQSEEWYVYGPLSPQDRQYLESGTITSYPYQRFSILGSGLRRIKIDPTPGSDVAGQTMILEYVSKRPIAPKSWSASMTVSSADTYIEYDGNYYISVSSGTTGATAPTHTTGDVSDGGVTWRYVSAAYDRFQADTDVCLIDEKVIEQGILERFAERQGVQVAARFDRQLQLAFERSKPGKRVYMDKSLQTRYPNAPRTEWAL